MTTSAHEFLDARGLLCPLPVLKARKRLKAMPVGAILKIETTDPMAVVDFPHFCAESGHELVSQTQDDELYVFEIRRN